MTDSDHSGNVRHPNTENQTNNPDPPRTERYRERMRENRRFIPVILKRSDEVVKHPDDTLAHAIREGLEQIDRPMLSLFLSSYTAGLIMGFVAMLVAFAALVFPDIDHLSRRLLIAVFYPLGVIICVMSRVLLFTEQTATATYPALDRQVGVKSLAALFVTVILGNLAGTFTTSFILTEIDVIVHLSEGYHFMAEHFMRADAPEMFVSAVLAGWLMAQGSWLILSTTEGTTQLLCIYLVTFVIGIGGFHHSIAGSAELFTTYFSSDMLAFSTIAKAIGVVVLGNLVGGSIFVGVLNYAHIRHTQQTGVEPKEAI